MSEQPIRFHKGRGTALRPQARYDRQTREGVDDGWDRSPDADDGGDLPRAPQTVVIDRPGKTIITRNDSPDPHRSVHGARTGDSSGGRCDTPARPVRHLSTAGIRATLIYRGTFEVLQLWYRRRRRAATRKTLAAIAAFVPYAIADASVVDCRRPQEFAFHSRSR